MTTFFEDPRLRQRWNEISHNAEAVTETAAAGIWTFSHNYINPCISGINGALDLCCLTPCFGDPDERALRAQRRRRRGRLYSDFDFYDDWDANMEAGFRFGDANFGGNGYAGLGASVTSGGIEVLNWGAQTWDRLVAGTGGRRRQEPTGEITATQPTRIRGMRYGAVAREEEREDNSMDRRRSPRRKKGRRKDRDSNTSLGGGALRGFNADQNDDGDENEQENDDEDNTSVVTPPVAPLSFFSTIMFPWKTRRTLRYKPSAAGLKVRQRHDAENTPLLGHDVCDSSSDDYGDIDAVQQQQRYQSRRAHVFACSPRSSSRARAANVIAVAPTTTMTTTSTMMTSPRRSRRPSSYSSVASNLSSSNSLRSRRDLFPSDEEGEADAVPLDDDFVIPFDSTSHTSTPNTGTSSSSVSLSNDYPPPSHESHHQQRQQSQQQPQHHAPRSHPGLLRSSSSIIARTAAAAIAAACSSSLRQSHNHPYNYHRRDVSHTTVATLTSHDSRASSVRSVSGRIVPKSPEIQSPSPNDDAGRLETRRHRVGVGVGGCEHGDETGASHEDGDGTGFGDFIEACVLTSDSEKTTPSATWRADSANFDPVGVYDVDDGGNEENEVVVVARQRKGHAELEGHDEDAMKAMNAIGVQEHQHQTESPTHERDNNDRDEKAFVPALLPRFA